MTEKSIEELLAEANARVADMTPEQRAEMWDAQRKSWVSGEMALSAMERETTSLHVPLPVAGYAPQSDANVALVNEFKQDEERLLRKLDKLAAQAEDLNYFDKRWVAIARAHFQEGFMALNRAVFRPQRIKLPEDAPALQPSTRLIALNPAIGRYLKGIEGDSVWWCDTPAEAMSIMDQSVTVKWFADRPSFAALGYSIQFVEVEDQP